MAKVNFYSISPIQYSSLSNKDNDALYFLTNGEIYKGDNLLSNNVVLIPDGEDYPETGITNILYAKASGESAFWNGSSYTLISRSIINELESLKNRVNETIRLTMAIDSIIDRTITHIENSNITNVGNYVFSGCTKLESVVLPNVTSIGENGFSGCTKVESVVLPNVTNVGSYVFSGCARLTTVNLPNVTNVGSYAFSGCTRLTTVNLPNVTNVGNYAFISCRSLESVNLHYLQKIVNNTYIDRNIFSESKNSLTTIDLHSILTIKQYSFQNFTKLTSIDLHSVTTIETYAFRGCSSLTSVDLSNVITIGETAFGDCINLSSIDLPNATTISVWAFGGCTRLTTVNLPNVTNVGSYAFSGCTLLTTVIISKNQIPTLANVNAFSNTPIASGTGYIYVPDNLVNNYKSASNWKVYKNQIKSINELPNN